MRIPEKPKIEENGMSIKIRSVLVGLSFAVCLAAGSTLVAPRQALAEKDCSQLDTNSAEWVKCAREQTNEIRRDQRLHDEECERGGCGPKAGAIQKRINRENSPRRREADPD